MIRAHRWLLVLAVLFMVSMDASASCPADKGFFQPSCEDATVYYLNNIFGTFNPDIAEFLPTNNLFGKIFALLTEWLITIGLFILVYVMLTGVVHLAASGEFLGRGTTLWTPIRMILGLVFLMPKGNAGYCLIQSLVMWVIFAGIGAGDTVWSTLTKEYADRSIYSTGLGSNDTKLLNEVAENAKRVIQGMVCRYIVNYEENNYIVDPGGGIPLQTFHIVSHSPTGDDPNLAGNANILDSSLNRSTFTWGASMQDLVSFMIATSQDATFRWYTYGVHNLQGPNNTISPDAAIRFGQYISGNDTVDKQCGEIPSVGEKYAYFINYSEATKSVVREYVIKYEQNKNQDIQNISLSAAALQALQQDTIHFAKCLKDPQNTPDCSGGDTARAESAMDRAGWMVAGFYYVGLAKDGLGGLVTPNLAMDNYQFTMGEKNNKDNNSNQEAISNRIVNLITRPVEAETGNPLDSLYNDAVRDTYSPSLSGADVNFFLYVLALPASAIVKAMTAVYQGQGDPFVDARDAGFGLMTAASYLLIMAALAVFFPTLVTANCKAQISVGQASVTPLQYIGMVIISLSGFMFVEGALLAVFLPIIPLLAWVMAVVGYFMFVIEAIVASPLIGLALIWPDQQQELLGRAEGSALLLLNLLIRPSLILIGYVIAMLICRIAFSLAGLMLAVAANKGAPVMRPEPVFSFLPIGFMFAYVLMAIASKTFGLTSEVADRVIGYLGGQISSYGGAEQVGAAAKEGTRKGGGQFGDGKSHAAMAGKPKDNKNAGIE